VADYATYDEMRGATAAAQEIRELAKNVARELLTRGVADGSDPMQGWPLWSETVLRGETEPLEAIARFGWWNYKLFLALRVDGDLVTTVQRDGSMPSPNNDIEAKVPSVARDDVLFYPDVIQWEWNRYVDEAPARRMIDEIAAPAALAKPLGSALRQDLESLRSEAVPPERLGPLEDGPADAGNPPLKNRWPRFFGR